MAMFGWIILPDPLAMPQNVKQGFYSIAKQTGGIRSSRSPLCSGSGRAEGEGGDGEFAFMPTAMEIVGPAAERCSRPVRTSPSQISPHCPNIYMPSDMFYQQALWRFGQPPPLPVGPSLLMNIGLTLLKFTSCMQGESTRLSRIDQEGSSAAPCHTH